MFAQQGKWRKLQKLEKPEIFGCYRLRDFSETKKGHLGPELGRYHSFEYVYAGRVGAHVHREGNSEARA